MSPGVGLMVACLFGCPRSHSAPRTGNAASSRGKLWQQCHGGLVLACCGNPLHGISGKQQKNRLEHGERRMTTVTNANQPLHTLSTSPLLGRSQRTERHAN